MAIGVTKVHGNSAGVNNVGSAQSFANAAIINTGIAPPITAYKVTISAGVSGNLAQELGEPNGSGKVGAIETIIKTFTSNASILAFQVDAGTSGAQQVSIIGERSDWSATDLQTVLRTLGNVGAYGNVYLSGSGGSATCTVSSSGGIKLA